MAEKILKYSRTAVGQYDGVAQQYYWDCGPASAQIILQAAGINKTEDWLIKQIGTTTSGTNHSGLITPVLNSLLPGSGYAVKWLTKEPVPREQVEELWSNIKRSIDADRGAIVNFVAPPWNFPKGSRGSVSPNYRGNNTIYHYCAVMGWADDGPGGRHFWIADPGFSPYGYFCRLEDVARLVVPHSYAYAASAPIVVSKPEPAQPKPEPKPQPQPVIDFSRTDYEWRATQYGDADAVAAVVAAAKVDSRGRAALALLERVNPDALTAYIQKG